MPPSTGNCCPVDDEEKSFSTVEGFIGSCKQEICPVFEFGTTAARARASAFTFV
jgi:hypothetical protein